MDIATILAGLATRPPVRRNLRAGETLFRAGNRVKAVYVVSSGRMKLVRMSSSGSEVTLHRASAGESFAEPSLFSDRYHCDAIAESASELLAYDKAEIIQALAAKPDRMMSLLQHFTRQVQQLRSRAEILSLRGATDRLMGYFELCRQPEADTLRLDATWKQVATEIGLTHEALYRALRRLEQSGAIERNGSQVRLNRR
jgi:CRP-like cAMP-binding protein